MHQITFSRHAKRRMKLYEIPESVIISIVEKKSFRSLGKQELIEYVSGFKLPVKIVIDVQETVILVITTYLLKRRKK